MGLFAALKGDIYHFNSNAVPVLNDIFAKLNTLPDSVEKEILLKMLVTANKGVDILFHPDNGIIKSKVKSFDKESFYAIYEMVILFLILNLKNVKFEKAETLKEMFIKAIGRADECNSLYNEMDEFSKSDERIFKPIWKKISGYASDLSREQELAFVSAFSDLFAMFASSI